MNAIEEIAELEQRLLQAMLKSDVDTLDRLLSDELIFTDHTGHLVEKSADLDGHRTGKVSIDSIEPGERLIKTFQDTAIVSVLMAIKGKYMDQPFEGKNRYTRVWVKKDHSWKVVAAHASVVD